MDVAKQDFEGITNVNRKKLRLNIYYVDLKTTAPHAYILLARGRLSKLHEIVGS